MKIKHAEKHLEKLEILLSSYLNSFESQFIESVKYTLMAPCKRIRPLIMIAFYELCGGKGEKIYNFAAAIEMIHTYSLIHDDLPCMDDSKQRRGKECNHLKFGEDVALLAGDALITQAFEIVSKDGSSDAKNALRCINILANCAGINGMILGQYLDLKVLKNKPDKILEVYKLKTGALFSAAAKIGAILAGADENQISCTERWAENIGILFQIVDDILDKDIMPTDIISGVKALDLISDLTEQSNIILKDNFSGDTSFLEYLTYLIRSHIN